MEEKKKGLLDTGVFLKFFLGEDDKEMVRKLLIIIKFY
jgi:predicted nucleic acid-binding protein